jgi:hypothetical protein
MLTISVSQLIARLRNADRVLLAVAVLTLLGLLYSGNRTLAWWDAHSQATSLRLEAQQLQTAISNARAGGATGTTTLAQYQAQLDAETAGLEHTTDDVIIGVMGDLARESRVMLASAGVVSAGSTTVGPVTYRIVKVSARVEGQLSRLYEYIDLVSRTVPSSAVVSARLGGFGLSPFVTLDIEMLVDPRGTAAGSAG